MEGGGECRSAISWARGSGRGCRMLLLKSAEIMLLRVDCPSIQHIDHYYAKLCGPGSLGARPSLLRVSGTETRDLAGIRKPRIYGRATVAWTNTGRPPRYT